LETVSEVKDMGVIISVKRFEMGEAICSAAVKKANKLLGMIKRNFEEDKRNNIAFIQKPAETSPRILMSDMEPILQ